MDDTGFNLPKVVGFLFCNHIMQDVLTKNYELKGVFQGFNLPQYPFGVEFVTFARFYFEKGGEFQLEISLFNTNGEKITDSVPRKLSFQDSIYHDLITVWRIMLPGAGTYIFKVFCNNLNLGDFKLICR